MAVFRCSCHQITWGDNLVEAIDDIGSFGYAGTETFGTVVAQFAGRAHDFQAMLEARGLRLSALYGGGPLHDPAQQAEAIANNLAIIDFLHEMGSDRLVVGPGKRTGTPTAQDLARFARGVSEVAAAARDKGIVAGMHPHWNTVIEQRDEITRFFDAVDTDLVKLALDPAHIAKAGDDPVEVASSYRDILTYMHIKDYVPELDGDRPDVASAQDHAPRIAFFGELGTGVVDLPALLDVAREADYDGWLTVELDRSQTTPRQSLEVNSRYLIERLGFDLGGENA
ncbi:MAG: sugar phosphate isomerase/epimerase [Chloroflexota bacterium]|nr:sugar phosphate isomerase/epimerase [Chloroflexota bacterium]